MKLINTEIQRLDFQRSDIRWVTKREKSQGSFKVEALIRLSGNSSSSTCIYALGVPVLAGNMFVGDGLCKSPPYMFEVAVGLLDHVIFRTGMSPALRAEADTLGSNTVLFDSFDINLVMQPAKLLLTYDEIAKHYFQRDHFTCLISISIGAGGTIELEFPIKHLNLLPSRRMWQFETGPIIYLKNDQIDAFHEFSVADLLPYFVHCNRFDSAEFFPDFPFSCGSTMRSANVKSRKLGCQVKFFGSDI